MITHTHVDAAATLDLARLRRISEATPLTLPERNIRRELAKAEADMTAAWTSGDNSRVRAAKARVNQLDSAAKAAASRRSLHSAALRYAELGYEVFPLAPGTKLPTRGSNGFKAATRSPSIIDDWWTRCPDYNIGLRTGVAIEVIDIDGPNGQASFAQNWDRFDEVYADRIAQVSTPRPGGMHIYIPAQGRPTAHGVLPGIDFKALGGYVAAPPSRIADTAANRARGWHPGTYQFRN